MMLSQMSAEMRQFEHEVSHLMDSGWSTMGMSPTMDMRDHGDCYVLAFSLPGMNPSNVELRLEGQLLTVSSLMDEKTPSGRGVRHYQQKVRLPGPVSDSAQPEAMMTNGILRVMIPKGQDGKTREPPPQPPRQKTGPTY